LPIEVDELVGVDIFPVGKRDQRLEHRQRLVLDCCPFHEVDFSRCPKGHDVWVRRFVRVPSAFGSCGLKKSSLNTSTKEPFG
jgi:hypothetical protein